MGWKHSDTLNNALQPKAAITGYNAAQNSTARSLVVFPTNSFVEYSPYNRIAINTKSRALHANLPIFNSITETIAKHSVGKGIFVRPTTSDTEWNKKALQLFEEWASSPTLYSIDGSRDHYEDQFLIACNLISEGENFTALVNNPQTKLPQIQPLDNFEVGSPMFLENAEEYTDGVRLNAYGRPISYAVQEMTAKGGYRNNNVQLRDIKSYNMLHVFKRRRPKQVRGFSQYFSAINSGIDSLDIKALITGTAKLHSGLAVSVTGQNTNQGGAFNTLDKARNRDNELNSHGVGVEKIFGGGVTTYLQPGQELKLHSSSHPSQNLLEYIKLLYHEIALSLSIPFEAVYSLSPLGGASVRGSLEEAQFLFDQIQNTIVERHSFPLYRWYIAVMMKIGKLEKCKDPIWWSCSFRGPKQASVDFSRSTQSNIMALRNGALTYNRYYDERGLEADREINDQIDFIAKAVERCKEKGVKPKWLFEGITLEEQTQETIKKNDN